MIYHCEDVFKCRNEIKELIRLGLNREKVLTSKFNDTEVSSFTDDADLPEEKELINYLVSLDFETIKVIQTLMYIGREGGCKGDTPYEIYTKERAYMDERGWSKKAIEAAQIEEKMPLGAYLINGLGILQVQF